VECKRAGYPTVAAMYKSNSRGCLHEVATKQANELGIHDMSGNVWEWCEDLHRTLSVPPNSYTFRLIRGGNYESDEDSCVVYKSSDVFPEFRGNTCGFRVARNAAP
jgi:formylglycine-generating enzyme required for sulfatase activity